MQSSKEKILSNLESFESNLPSLEIKHSKYQNPLKQFISMAKKSGANVYRESDFNIQNIFKDVKLIVDTSTKNRLDFKNLQNVDLTILNAKFGVAENGAVWIEWMDEFYPRALLTISKYLVIFLKRESIVDNLAQAYEMIDFKDITYGVFLSGPSKTADIEQSLVIGAHGALRVAIVLI